MVKYKRVFNFKEVISVLIPLIVVVMLWDTKFLLMFKIFVVMLHEYSHALVAMLTGGNVISIGISSHQSGYTTTLGGNDILITSAGYIGSVLFGVIFLFLARIKKLSKYFIILLGMAIIVMTGMYVRELYTLLYSIIFTIVLVAIAMFGDNFGSYFLRFLGVLTTLYALYDIRSDLFLSKGRELNDAVILAKSTGIPAIFWSGVWVVISILVLYYLFLTKREKVEYY